jgi:hypothetical protein
MPSVFEYLNGGPTAIEVERDHDPTRDYNYTPNKPRWGGCMLVGLLVVGLLGISARRGMLIYTETLYPKYGEAYHWPMPVVVQFDGMRPMLATITPTPTATPPPLPTPTPFLFPTAISTTPP